MLACLPLISLILLFLVLRNPSQDWRASVLSAAVIWGVLIIAFTEILSLFRWLTFGYILTLWLLTILVLSWLYYQLIKQGKRSLKLPTIPKISPVSLVLLSGVVFIVAIIGLIAVVSPPNNWDSMTYHMSRVVHWIQNHSVAHYPTPISAQLVHPPFAEFTIMHLQIFSGGDKLANLVQWLSMVGSIIGVSLIAKQLGAQERGQVLAAVFCATIPMGILQGSSTQNDYVVAFWLVCLAHYVLSVLSYKKLPLSIILGVASSLGLAVFTKSSGYIYAFPFMVWLFLWGIKHLGWKLWKPFCIVITVFVLLNLGHYLRNLDLYGNPIATADYTDDYKIEVYSLPTLISNIMRNLSLHVDIVRYLNLQAFITPITGKVDKLVSIIHDFIGVNINDPRTTFPLNSYRVPGLSFDENIAGNPLHFLIILISIFCIFLKRSIRNNKVLISYLLTIIGGFLLMCFMLKIQPYQSRHHLSLFVLFSPLVGYVLCQILNRYLLIFIAVLFLITSLQFVFKNKFRLIAAENNIFNTSRNELYFTNRRYLAKSYIEATDFVEQQNCSQVGLSLVQGAWEYPFWALLKTNKQGESVQFQHILPPNNISNRKSQLSPDKNFTFCAVIAVRRDGQETVDKMILNDSTYQRKWMSKPVTILLKE